MFKIRDPSRFPADFLDFLKRHQNGVLTVMRTKDRALAEAKRWRALKRCCAAYSTHPLHLLNREWESRTRIVHAGIDKWEVHVRFLKVDEFTTDLGNQLNVDEIHKIRAGNYRAAFKG